MELWNTESISQGLRQRFADASSTDEEQVTMNITMDPILLGIQIRQTSSHDAELVKAELSSALETRGDVYNFLLAAQAVSFIAEAGGFSSATISEIPPSISVRRVVAHSISPPVNPPAPSLPPPNLPPPTSPPSQPPPFRPPPFRPPAAPPGGICHIPTHTK